MISSVSPRTEPAIEQIDVSAYTVPTDGHESDGTIERNSTTIVIVEISAGSGRGLGYSYATAGAARIIRDHLAPVVLSHRHHRAILKMTKEEQLLKQVGLDSDLLDSGCCSMAGSFGFEKGERVLLPAGRNAPKDTLIIADGFSCQEQIAKGTGRHALHLAEAVNMAMRKSKL